MGMVTDPVDRDDPQRNWVRRGGGARDSEESWSLRARVTVGYDGFAVADKVSQHLGSELRGRGDDGEEEDEEARDSSATEESDGALAAVKMEQSPSGAATIGASGTREGSSEEEDFRRIIRRLRKNKVKLFSHLTCNQRSIKYTVDLLTDEGWTPTERYHRLVAIGEKAPWPLTLKRSMCPISIDIRDQSLGDELGCLLAETLIDYPILESLNVAGCQLTDASLIPLINAIMNLPRLVALDLSCNDIDESSDVLRKYLESPQCRLRTLGLCQDDVDDAECGLVMESMRINKSLTSLDLAKNLIGESGTDDLMSTRGGPMGDTAHADRPRPALLDLPPGLLGRDEAGDDAAAGESPDMADTYATFNLAGSEYLGFRVIGAKAVAETLRVNTTLVELDLSNNFLRDASASTVADAIRNNSGLTRLDLSNNAFMDEPAQRLGDSLRFNTTLTRLDLSFNNISPKAAFVFASTLAFHNKTMQHLLLNGNMISKRALRAMYRAIRLSGEQGQRLIVEMMDCDADEASAAARVLDVNDPEGHYLLDLSPYEFAVANQLLHTANSSPGAAFRQLAFVSDDVFANVKEEPIVLKKRVIKSASNQHDSRLAAERLLRIHKQRGILYPEELGAFMKRLGLHPSRDTVWRIVKLVPDFDLTEAKLLRAIFVGVFREVDLDASGFIDLTEFMQAMNLLGLDLSEEVALQHIVEYDIDRSGSIEEPEFIMYMMERFSYKMLDFQKTELVTASGHAWSVPNKGVLKVHLRNELLPPTMNQVTTEAAVQQILENMKVSSRSEVDRMETFDSVILHSDIYFNSTQVLYLKNHLDLGLDMVGTIATILPQITNYKAALEITEPFLNLRQRFQLRKIMGNAFRPILGIPSGHYIINLENRWDRIAMRKLAELDNKARLDAHVRGNPVDTSQRGNFSAFRNETFNGQPLEITTPWILRDLPPSGIVRFDFVCTLRPQVDIPPITNRRLRQLMSKLGFRFPEPDAMAATSAIALTMMGGSSSSSGNLLGGNQRQQDPGSSSAIFTSSMASADGHIASGGSRENYTRNHTRGTDGSKRSTTPARNMSAGREASQEDTTFKELLYEDPLQNLTDVLGPFNSVMQNFRELKATSKAATLQRARRQHLDRPIYQIPLDDLPTGGVTSSFGSSMAHSSVLGMTSLGATVVEYHTNATERPVTDKVSYVRSILKICELELTVTPIWLTCEQAIVLLKNFSSDDYVRVSALCIVFSKILDLDNFHKVMSILDASEREELAHRLGYLNVCDPGHPDMVYQLDMAVYEEKRICEMLVLLAILNGPFIWRELRYKRSRIDEWDYDWFFPLSWVKEICRSKRGSSQQRTGGVGFGETRLMGTGSPSNFLSTKSPKDFHGGHAQAAGGSHMRGHLYIKVRTGNSDFDGTLTESSNNNFINSSNKSSDSDGGGKKPKYRKRRRHRRSEDELFFGTSSFSRTAGVSAFVVTDLLPALRSGATSPNQSTNNDAFFMDNSRNSDASDGYSDDGDEGPDLFEDGFDLVVEEKGGFSEAELLKVLSAYTLANVSRDMADELSQSARLSALTKTLNSRKASALLATLSSSTSAGSKGLFGVSERLKSLKKTGTLPGMLRGGTGGGGGTTQRFGTTSRMGLTTSLTSGGRTTSPKLGMGTSTIRLKASPRPVAAGGEEGSLMKRTMFAVKTMQLSDNKA